MFSNNIGGGKGKHAKGQGSKWSGRVPMSGKSAKAPRAGWSKGGSSGTDYPAGNPARQYPRVRGD